MATTKNQKFVEGVGRRKTAVARVRITPAGKNSLIVNGKTLKEHFLLPALVKKVEDVIATAKAKDRLAITVKVKGGGSAAQAEAVVHGLARAISAHDRESRPALKKAKFLTRDARAKERRKFGLKKARKAPQWSKR